MFKNYLITAWRNLWRHKFYSATNSIGLAIGIAFSLLIGVFIRQEWSVNSTLKDADRLCILESRWKEEGMGFPILTPAPASKELKEQYPGLVENYYRFWERSVTVSKDNQVFREQVLMGDTTFFSMFGFPVLYGDAETALQDPHAVVITRSLALKYFGKENAVHEVLTLATEASGNQDHVVMAVLKDLPRNSVSNLVGMDAQLFLPLTVAKHFRSGNEDSWWSYMLSYIKRTPGTSQAEVQRALEELFEKNRTADQKDRLTHLEAIPLTEYYLVSNNAAIQKLLFTLLIILVFIMLVAMINFVNITIGNSITRLKEIGVRKVIGGVKRQLIFQFLADAVIQTYVATLCALILYQLLQSYFSDLLMTSLPSLSDFGPLFWTGLAGSVLFLGILAGTYPAFMLSSLRPIESLKGKMGAVGSKRLFARALLIVQFMLAIVVFFSALVISRQVSFFLSKNLGYTRSGVLTVSSVPRIWSAAGGLQKMEEAKKEFLILSHVQAVTLSWEVPNGNFGNVAGLYTAGRSSEEALSMPMLIADEAYASVYAIEVKEGVFFQQPQESHWTNRLVINEAAQKALQVSVGDKLRITGSDSVYTLAGVVKDFNYASLRDKIGPIMFRHTDDVVRFRYFSFRLASGNLPEAVDALEKKWKEVFPQTPFVYAFMDKNLQDLYKTELQLSKASGIATVLVLIIAGLGMLGLVAMNVSQRTREIGIRKVLGATVSAILVMLSKEYIRLILVALMPAIPAAFFLTSRWLDEFAYRIHIAWWMYAMPVSFVLLLVILVVTGQSLKTALANPVDSLRTE